jgi:hypothetical protein
MTTPEYWGWRPADASHQQSAPSPASEQPEPAVVYKEYPLLDHEDEWLPYDPYQDQQYEDHPNASEPSSFRGEHDPTTAGGLRNGQSEPLQKKVHRVLRSTLSALHGMTTEPALQLLTRIRSSKRVLDRLDDESRQTVLAALEVLEHEASVLTTGRLDLGHLPVAEEYQAAVRVELTRIANEVGSSTPADPHAEWQDLVESVQRVIVERQAIGLVEGIREKLPTSELVKRQQEIESPTTKKAVSRERTVKTARQVAEEARAATAGRPALRFSSGLRTLDIGYTGKGESLGFVAGGQFSVIMGPTGTGKTSFSNSLTPAVQLDLQNWGLRDGLQVVFHTEEETIDKLRGFRMDIGQKYHHLTDNLVIDACGTSRTRIAEVLYDTVISADEKARATKRPISDFLPYVCQIDYIQSIQEAGEDPTTASAVTAEFFLRGVCAWNPEEMAKFSGVDFREYAGMAWPSGMEHHRVAVIAYAQLVKVDDESLYYKPNKRGVQLSDFALLNGKDEPYWDVREGDLRLFGKNQMRGSGIIAQNSHNIVILHRSVPYNNPAYKDENGGMHLTDTRARLLFDKSRAGSQLAYAPMRFDVQSTGFRAQYFDELAERAIESGKLTDIHPSYTEPGDPILPVRPVSDPLSECRY